MSKRGGILRIGALSVWRSSGHSLTFELGRLRVGLRRGIQVLWWRSPSCARDVLDISATGSRWRGGASCVLVVALGQYGRGLSLAVQVGRSVFMDWRAFSVELRALRSWTMLFSARV